ncbi:MAG: bifunctional DNA-formamidopyrimidine glycosylase/DNA-(apurinic or apyrimidinic site) lyase [Gammaproteobacteria bacterium]|nr:bifunctional DNA-formamidopyrimidine glycosylase/DNA-(apurinic or apyrimidinic site) lyase [Gammaproteobacteria bacterium]
MPELPEVETTRRGIAPALEGRTITEVVVRDRRLRWPVPRGLEARLAGQPVLRVRRRAKYLLVETPGGTAMVHLGMSGSMRIVNAAEALRKHDHFDLVTDSGDIVRFNDPRRFGSLLWAGATPATHPLIRDLGPEPLPGDFDADEFTGDYLWTTARKRKVTIKQHIMNANIVVGVGNIYASEALFRAGIHPSRQAGRVSRARIEKLVAGIQTVLADAIRVGGTTLRDYSGGDGKPGYFRQKLNVYERGGKPCRVCGTEITRTVHGQRATYYCKTCQT